MFPNSIELNIVWLIIIWVASTAITATATWYKLKGRIAKIDTCMKTLKGDHLKDHQLVSGKINETKEDLKELKAEVRSDKEQIITKMDGIKKEMSDNHLEVLKWLQMK